LNDFRVCRGFFEGGRIENEKVLKNSFPEGDLFYIHIKTGFSDPERDGLFEKLPYSVRAL